MLVGLGIQKKFFEASAFSFFFFRGKFCDVGGRVYPRFLASPWLAIEALHPSSSMVSCVKRKKEGSFATLGKLS